MKNKKKLNIVLSALLAAACLLSFSCSKKDDSNKMRFVSLAWQQNSIATNKKIINEWNSLHPDKQVEYVQANWGAVQDYLVTAFETKDVPDVFQYESSMIIDFAVRGNLADLKPLISDSTKADIHPNAWSSVTLDNGMITGVPFLFETMIILYNKDMFEKAGITPPDMTNPWNWDDLRAAAKKLTKKSAITGQSDQWGAALGLRNSANIIMNLTLGFGGGYFQKNGNEYSVKVGVPEKTILGLLMDMIYKDKTVSPLAVSQTGSGVMPGFYSGRYAMVVGIGTWARQQLIENAPKDFRWGVLPPLKAVTQDQGSNTQTLSIPKDSHHQKDAMAFIEFFLNTKHLAELAQGDWSNPTRKSVLRLPEFKTEKNGWNICTQMVEHLKMGPWLNVPGYSEWKGRVANPIFQELFSNRMTIDEAAFRIEEESGYVLSRYKMWNKK